MGWKDEELQELEIKVARKVLGMDIRNVTPQGCELHSHGKVLQCGPLEKYARSRDACELVEGRIATLGLQSDYLAALWDQLALPRTTVFWTSENFESFWRLTQASPEMRCLAALAVVRNCA